MAALFRLVKYYNLPIYYSNIYKSIVTFFWNTIRYIRYTILEAIHKVVTPPGTS